MKPHIRLHVDIDCKGQVYWCCEGRYIWRRTPVAAWADWIKFQEARRQMGLTTHG